MNHPTVPRKWIIGPAVILLIVGGLFALVALSEGGQLNVHGGGGYMLLFFALTTAITGVIELVALPVAVSALLRAPETRSTANTITVAIGLVPLFVALWIFTH